METAFTYGLLKGYEDGTFRPMGLISREEASRIIANAMRLTGLQAPASSGEPLLPSAMRIKSRRGPRTA